MVCGCICLFLTFPLSHFPLLICIYQRLPCSQATASGERPDVFSIWQFSIRLSLQSLLLQTSCVPSLRLFSQSCLSLKGHLERTADVSRKDLEAVLASSCFTQKSDGFFLVNSLLTALNYTEEAEEKGEAGVEKFVWKKKYGKTPPLRSVFRSGFSVWSREQLIPSGLSRGGGGAAEDTVTQPPPPRAQHSVSVPAALANRISG